MIDASKGPVLEKASERTRRCLRFDVVYDATGNGNSMQAAFAYVAHGGVMIMVSVVQDGILSTFSDPEFHKREMMLIGSRNAARADFQHVDQVDTLRRDIDRPACHSSHDTAQHPAATSRSGRIRNQD